MEQGQKPPTLLVNINVGGVVDGGVWTLESEDPSMGANILDGASRAGQ